MRNTHLVLLIATAGSRSAVAFPAVGAQSSRRFLVLHNSRTTGGAFVNSPTQNGAKAFLSGVPRRVDAGQNAPPNWLYSAVDCSSADGCWWSGELSDLKGIEASIAAVEDAMEEFQAVGLIGHEQGATLAAIIAARAALGEGPPLKFAVICGGYMPSAGPQAELLQRLRETSDVSIIPTLHCISSTDSFAPSAQAEQLAACFGPSAEILQHDGGSAMPGPEWWKQTKAFPERVTGGRYWCTQFEGPFWY
jgi:predicted esterase